MIPPLITSWLHMGELVQVITAHIPPETGRQHKKRHQDAVDFLMEVFPEDESE